MAEFSVFTRQVTFLRYARSSCIVLYCIVLYCELREMMGVRGLGWDYEIIAY